MQAEDIDFLIIGAAKCATTWLQQSLQADPDVSMPDPELHYFSRHYDRGDDWYFRQFHKTRPGQLVGEKSNSYLDTPSAPQRVHRLLPHVRLIVQLRNPVERAYSDYCMLFRRGEVDRDIESYLDVGRDSPGRFLAGGLYSAQLQAYLDLYPKDRLLVLFFEETVARPVEQLSKVRTFLNLPESDVALPVAKKVKDRSEAMVGPQLRNMMKPLKPLVRPFRNTSLFEAARGALAGKIAYPPFPPRLRSQLVDFYAADVEQLGTLVQRDLSGWLVQTGGSTSLD
ncbi:MULTISPECIES: sulfotransferase [Mesorhizobium]|uniref:Sulfotransferase n=1 Tax=Mesorhizobium opportunistum (strain LMG 24607 / HAMBI 3007 / WSM2075) TaxID=536019 RepID=F7YBB3_MESOW|nr:MULTISPECIES: sulfotransferase [Mesorhizobium]AEH86583.1 sulfotransferase [Mesorhizobium opportunistum WSM2075]MCA0032463.1 sulfotransferase [Mesorhizobium sp. B263B2A]TPN44097.1 sulfotransferase domain-containing protein [Mesorhizobium sp. B1-1-9]TPN54835.1 sulfotransferase domain-containing protein [Mesorhizobium sp. B1-1-7]